MTLFSTFLRAMILAMCLAACLIEQPTINLLNIYINNNKGNNNNDIVQNMQFATLSYIICFVKANNAFFAANGTIKTSLFVFLFFSFVVELFVVCVLTETCYFDNSSPIEMVQQMMGLRVLCVCILCTCVYVCKWIKGRVQSPNDDVNIMKARALFFSPQGSHVLRTNPPVSACDTFLFFFTD